MYKSCQMYGNYFKMPFLDLQNYELDNNIVSLIPKELAEKHKIVAIDLFNQVLTIGITKLEDKNIIPMLEEKLKKKIIPFLISLTSFEEAFGNNY